MSRLAGVILNDIGTPVLLCYGGTPPHGGVTFVETGSKRRQVRSLEIVRVYHDNTDRGDATARGTK